MLQGLIGVEFVLFSVFVEVWGIHGGELWRWECGMLLILLTDFDVGYMCGLGSVPDKRAGVGLCERAFA